MLIRSIIFTQLFLLSTLLQLIFWMPVYFFFKREDGWKVVKLWGLISLWMQNRIIGTKFDFRGVENIPHDGGIIVASKHQSSWETYTMVLFMRDPSYIIKRELMYVPLFGWFAYKMKAISVNRGKRSKALKAMAKIAKDQYRAARQIIIYPEGTRKMAYADPDYKYGLTFMYDQLNARVLPVALNSGLFWPRRGWRVYPGTCVLEFLPIIEPGLSQEEFTTKIKQVIEDKTNALMQEAEDDPVYAKARHG